MSGGHEPKIPKWWLALTTPEDDWEIDDLEEVKELIAEKPPLKELEHVAISAFISGFFQACGELGYIEMVHGDQRILTPYISLAGDVEVVEAMARLFGDVQEKKLSEDGRELSITVTGLRAIIILRVISSLFKGWKRRAAEKMLKYGYKLTDLKKYERLREELEVAEDLIEVSRKPVKILKRRFKPKTR